MKRVNPNEDKPHRCPECHGIPDEARKDGLAVIGKIYQCDACQVDWVAHYGDATEGVIARGLNGPAR